MDKEELKKLAENPNNIVGIYNYCDRWCERCSFTSRCLNYEFSEEQFGSLEDQDLNNKIFWNKLSEVFKLTFELIAEEAAELGIDLNSIDADEAKIEFDKHTEDAKENICVKAADKYMRMVTDWLDLAGDLFKTKEEQFISEDELGLPDSSPMDDALTITDAIEVIQWYQMQIYVKLMRAVGGRFDELEDEDTEDYPKDSDGSAKVALIGIDRSIAAWGKLLKQFSDKEDEILEILVHLTRLRKSVEKDFPEARAFVRAGFDD